MKIGYPCKNLSLATGNMTTFRLASYSEERLIQAVETNLTNLAEILKFNTEHRILLFRLSSDIVPFASHPVMKYSWQGHFKELLQKIGLYMLEHGMRGSVHPGQFVLLNSPRPEVVESSISELTYHAELLDLLGLDSSAKIQIHVGGTYGDKEAAIRRFVEVYETLPLIIKKRLVIENDERQYSLADCLELSSRCGVPVLFDVFHHSLLNAGETVEEALRLVATTWKKEDGLPIMDYSSQDPTKQKGAHTQAVDIADFANFYQQAKAFDVDIMLEIKDKESSALKVLEYLRNEKAPFLLP